ncbi:DUF4224 domain-containing protein [Burkholderia sp. Bp8984]|uniref:DUF4224 domain-containing protein n=1 Tax=Burkholderia sp. Bp8984 TaxID=2184549 RepID=UPI000F5A29ED|nr:DUF4224 domain-containing protein [Burkholderia sp. Bp8984]RQS63861.1 DUF4224 domain-containing protein [Burkholderia sp. Bp8984]
MAADATPKSDLFLTVDEVAELTGIRNGRRGQTREELQIAWLRTSGIPFWINARGRPIIARARITGQPTEPPPRPKWQPKALNPDGTLKLNPDGTLKTD